MRIIIISGEKNTLYAASIIKLLMGIKYVRSSTPSAPRAVKKKTRDGDY